ncbi:DUF1800 domain-containing protein [Gemmatimonas sp.]|jgi:uncharacterized protein (DUF1800 family)|uniref:DUF1800 domain-containing protein n=1 Tax=Gemmatimonas sp. TaxID=1962908 RepID=UPI0037C10F5F
MPSEPTAASRRDLLRQSAVALGAATLAAPLLAGPADAQPPRQPNTGRIGGLLNQLSQQTQWKSPELRLVRRVTLGLSEADVVRVQQLGYTAYLEEQLNPGTIPDPVMDARLQAPLFTQLLGFTPRQLAEQQERGSSYFDAQLPMSLLTSERAICSRRQLQERMYEFFLDQLYVPIWNSGLPPIHYERTIRPHVLGSFGALTRAGMRSTSMLQYLDQIWSTRWGVNENYARELMELHTVGWDGGYTQADVAGLARILTGWSMNADMEFEYKAWNHDFGAKRAFGMSFPARPQADSGTAGMDEGIAFGEMLIRHPSTKRFLATKMLRWFVSPDPTEAQIQAVINAYGAEGDIKAMLRVALSRENLMRAPAMLKRPFHYGVSVLRATQATLRPVVDIRRDYLSAVYPINNMSQPFMNWPTPDGYPDHAEFWAGLIVDRWNEANNNLVSEFDAPGRAVTNWSLFMGNGTEDGAVRAINTRLFGGEMSLALENELRVILRPGVNSARVASALRLAVTAPEFHFF